MNVVKVNRKEGFESFHSDEAYKTLRTNLEFAGEDNRAIAITSCSPREGKSAVSYNLAVSLAQTGKRVLFVDTDMRRSRFLGQVETDVPIKGLSYYLSGQAALSDVLVHTDTPHLYAIFAGPVPPNPAELLGSKHFTKLLEEAKKAYDYVIIDTPPLGSVIDAAIVAQAAGSVAIVVEEGTTSYKFVRVVKDQLEKADCNILGVILNKAEQKKGKYYNSYYGGYYNSYNNDYK